MTDPYGAYRDLIGRSLLLGLEFLVSADVIRTVALELTPRNIGTLGALVVIRTFLSWSVVVETEGHWHGSRHRAATPSQGRAIVVSANPAFDQSVTH